METSVDRMAGLIDDVMDFARGRLGGGIKIELNASPLEPVLRQVVSELEISEPSRVFEREFELHEPVSFDAGRRPRSRSWRNDTDPCRPADNAVSS